MVSPIMCRYCPGLTCWGGLKPSCHQHCNVTSSTSVPSPALGLTLVFLYQREGRFAHLQALLLFPNYLSWSNKRYCPPQQAQLHLRGLNQNIKLFVQCARAGFTVSHRSPCCNLGWCSHAGLHPHCLAPEVVISAWTQKFI